MRVFIYGADFFFFNTATFFAASFFVGGLQAVSGRSSYMHHALSPKRSTKKQSTFFSRPLIRGGYKASGFLLTFLGRGRDIDTCHVLCQYIHAQAEAVGLFFGHL
jgi:hypothetical protein